LEPASVFQVFRAWMPRLEPMDEGRREVPTLNPPRVHTPERLVVGIGPRKVETRVESRYRQTPTEGIVGLLAP
jgi:hypothetical protein